MRAICFDLDDTLYAYERYARAGLRSAAVRLEAKTGRQLHDELAELYFEEENTDGTFDELVARHDLSPLLVDELVEAFHAVETPLSPYPETEPVLTTLGEDYKLGLLTDGRGGHAKLDRLGLTSYFDTVLVTPTIERSKHDAVVFDRVLSALEVEPAATAAVGDDPRVDFRIPNETGMTTVRLLRGRYKASEPGSEAAKADYRIESLGELPQALRRLRARNRSQSAQ